MVTDEYNNKIGLFDIFKLGHYWHPNILTVILHILSKFTDLEYAAAEIEDPRVGKWLKRYGMQEIEPRLYSVKLK